MQTARYVQNTLEPVSLDEHSVQKTLRLLQQAVHDGIRLLEEHRREYLSAGDSIYVGSSGISLMCLRLLKQADALNLDSTLTNTLKSLSAPHQRSSSRSSGPISIRAGRLSPIDSPVGLATVRALGALHNPSGQHTVLEEDLQILESAVHAAKHDSTRTNEVLYGKAGLLFALLQLREAANKHEPGDERLSRLVNDEALLVLIQAIIRDGTEANQDELPLYFEWYGKCYLGAMHGIAGILTVLLQCPLHLISKYQRVLLASIDHLITLSLQNEGHLPSSLPVKHRSSSPLVQLCHGSPGLGLLLCTLTTLHPSWVTQLGNDTQQCMSALSEVIWEQGLLTKGIGICHGVSGNAWTLLLLARSQRGNPNGQEDLLVGKALAFLLHSIMLPPLHYRHSSTYRTPDRPYSLFEGLAGAICSWSEACVYLSERFGETKADILGMPGIGGVGVKGML